MGKKSGWLIHEPIHQFFVKISSLVFAVFSIVASSFAQPIDADGRDTRVPSDGKGLRLEEAMVTDPKRLRVILAGDSILNPYLAPEIKALGCKAYVDASARAVLPELGTTQMGNSKGLIDSYAPITELGRLRELRHNACPGLEKQSSQCLL